MIEAATRLHQGESDVKRIVIIIPSSFVFQPAIRDFTLAMGCSLTGCNAQWACRFQMIVDELCNNAIEHGSALGEDIALSFYSKSDAWFEVVVEDNGNGAHPAKAAELTTLMQTKKAQAQSVVRGLRGRGLAHIVAKWTDELEFTDRTGGGMMVRARVNAAHIS